AVVCGTYTSTAEPSAPATASRTSRVMLTSWLCRSVRSENVCTSGPSQSAAGGGWRADLERVLAAALAGEIVLDQHHIVLRPLDHMEERRHRRHLLALLLEEPVQELLADKILLVPRQ